MSERGSTRLGFLRRGVAATIVVGGIAGLDAADALPSSRPRLLVGTIKDVTRRGARVAVDGRGDVELTLAPNAKVSSGFRPERSDDHDLSAFERGDRISFSGTGAGHTFEATSVELGYERFSGVVVKDEGAVIRTKSGDILIPSDVRRDLPKRLAPGEKLEATVRRVAKARYPIAELVGLR